eukprot:12170307-Ditylum_brightwellii.AAC.1
MTYRMNVPCLCQDIDADDDNYDPNVKHLLSYPNNPKTKKKYVNTKTASKPSATSRASKTTTTSQ